jgi:FkbM family methyltransferase
MINEKQVIENQQKVIGDLKRQLIKNVNNTSMLNNLNASLNGIVCHKGVYWPVKDLGGDVTRDYAPPNGTCYKLMEEFPDVPYTISNLVKDKNVVLQAGGNAGFYVKKYSEIFNQVYTFEPEPLSFKCLNLNVTKPNVFKFQACLGDTHECVNLFNAYETLGHGGSHVSGKGLTPTFLIDDLNLPVCNLIHLDIEGYEKKALMGGVETIKRCRPVIAIECYPPWAERYGTNLNEIEMLLHSLDYKYFSEVQGDRVYAPIDY